MSQQIDIQFNQSFEIKCKQQPTIHMNEYESIQHKDDELIQNSLKKLPRFKRIEICFEVFALLVLIVCWAYFMKIFSGLPDQVPTEFDIDGQVIRYADKNFFYSLPCVMTIVYIIITVLQLVPHRLNYDCIGITVFNAQKIFLLTRIALLYNKIVTELLFSYVTFTLLQVVQYQTKSSRMYWAFAFVIPYLIGGLIYYKQLKKQH